MTLLGRRSREVYRVYSHDEFLDGAAQEFLDGPARRLASAGARGQRLPPRTGRRGREQRLRRLAGAAMLTGAVGTVGGVVAVHSLRGIRSAGGNDHDGVAAGRSRSQRRPAGTSRTSNLDGSLLARATGSDARAFTFAKGHGLEGRERVARAHAAAHAGAMADPRPAERDEHSQPREVVVRSTSAEIESRRASRAVVGARILAVSTQASASPAPSTHPEFGFER